MMVVCFGGAQRNHQCPTLCVETTNLILDQFSTAIVRITTQKSVRYNTFWFISLHLSAVREPKTLRGLLGDCDILRIFSLNTTLTGIQQTWKKVPKLPLVIKFIKAVLILPLKEQL